MKEAFKTRRSPEDVAAGSASYARRETAGESATARMSLWLSTPRGMLAAYAAALCVVALFYAIYTDQTWEDCLITLRHSENLLAGKGLTYNPPDRVHGFTSPINVLLLAVCHVLTGQKSYVLTCWLYRLFTIAAFAGGGVLLLRAFLAMTPRWLPAIWLVAIAYLFDGKSVAFSTNGMETGFMLAAIAWAIYLMTQTDEDQWLMRGLCWAALMWTRPDGCLYIAVMSFAEFLFGEAPRRELLTSLAKSAGICVLAYGPWVAWAWGYYGSPIPHTVIAKQNVDEGTFNQVLGLLDNFFPRVFVEAANSFRPIYYGENASWVPQPALGRIVNGVTKAVAIFCLIYWVFPRSDRWGRMFSFCFTCMTVYLAYMQLAYPWYFPPVAMFGFIALARGATQLAAWTRERGASVNLLQRFAKPIAMSLIGTFLLIELMLFAMMTRKEAVQQAEIEMGNRAEVGKWLKEHGRPDQTVYLEPLGYIGYFSGMHMVDFPGLVSPEVVRVRREKGVNRMTAIPELAPDWVVLRYSEVQMLSQLPIWQKFLQDYKAVHDQNANERLDKYSNMPGLASLRFDAGFIIFQRVAPSINSGLVPASKAFGLPSPPPGPPPPN